MVEVVRRRGMPHSLATGYGLPRWSWFDGLAAISS
jgi:hypothetical protein